MFMKRRRFFPLRQEINRGEMLLLTAGASMARLSDMTVVGLILTALLFFGAAILFRQVVTLNPIKSSTIYIVVSSTVFGLGFGILAGWFVTLNQLRILRMKGEWRLSDSKTLVFTTVAGLLVFLLVSFAVVMAGRPAFDVGEIYFVVAAAFTLYVSRMVLVVQFERQTKKFIMTDFWSNRLYMNPSAR